MNCLVNSQDPIFETESSSDIMYIGQGKFFNMRTLLPILALLLRNAILVSSTPAAPLLGPSYPPPADLTNNCSLVSAAWSNFSTTINAYIKRNQTLEGLVPNLGSYTFSVGAFSIFDAQAAEKLQYHHTGRDVETSNTGVTRVDGDSIYRIASITKAFTVYLTLIEVGSRYWDTPITEFVPELAKYSNNTASDALNVVDWKSVTLGALAGQIAGIPRDTALLGGDLLSLQALGAGPDLAKLGLPPLNLSSLDAVDPCVGFVNSTGVVCPRDPYFQAITKRAPVFSPWTSPIYTNAGFALLSLALEKITGRPFSTMFQEDMIKPLGMDSTTLRLTDLTRAVIPGGNTTNAYINYQIYDGVAVASGGVYSTIKDLARFGLSILNSTLLPPQETRKWLKPISHTSSLELSIGRPWEIFRITHPVNGRVSDLYTKEGDGQGFSSYLILSPDHGAGFTILIAGNASTVIANTAIADILTSTVIPALESQAAAEAAHKLAGTYISTSPNLNSSVTLSVDPSRGAGLLVTSWISNGTDMFSWLPSLVGGDELSLFPADLRSAPVGQAVRVAFRGTFGLSNYKRDVGIFVDQVTTNLVWANVDTAIYGGASLDLFVFDVDAKGNAITVTPAATRAKLQRKVM